MRLGRVTVFGGSGFIGRYLVEKLADRDAVVAVAVRDVEGAKFLRTLGQVGQVAPVPCAVQNEDSVAAAVAGSDAVINLVGILAQRGNQTFRALHERAPATIARAAAAAGVKRLVHVSALGADPAGPSKYARSKAAGEAAVRAAFPQATILRPSLVFGPEDGFFNLLGGLARLSPVLPLYNWGRTRFQPVWVGDVASAAMAALDRADAPGATWELGGPHVRSFAELARFVLSETRRRQLLLPLPWQAGIPPALVLGLLPKPPLTLDQLYQLRADSVVSDGATGLADLGIRPTAVEAIVPQYLARYRRGGRLGRMAEA